MKKQFISIWLILLLLFVIFSGCLNDNNKIKNGDQTEKLISASIENLLLKIEDLPQGYSINYSGTDYLSEFSSLPKNKPKESFSIWFSKGNFSNPVDYVFITCEINKFESIEDASNAYIQTLEYLITVGGFNVLEYSINITGTESKAITKSGYNIFSFRISNIICVMTSTDYSLIIELAEIVEQRINDNLN